MQSSQHKRPMEGGDTQYNKRSRKVGEEEYTELPAGVDTSKLSEEEKRRWQLAGAYTDCQEAADTQLDEIQDVIDQKMNLVLGLESIIDADGHPPSPGRLFERLDKVALALGLEPLPEDLRPKLPAVTVDYLWKLLTEFWELGPDHPALTLVDIDEDLASDHKFHLYVRMRKTSVGEAYEVIDALKNSRPINYPSLMAMKATLPAGDDTTIYEKYLGQTIVSPSGRRAQDEHRARQRNSSKTSKWFNRLRMLGDFDENSFQVYELYLDDIPAWPDGLTSSQAQLAIPAWGVLEYILILAAAGRSWNSAPGGLNLMYSLPVTVKDVILMNEKAVSEPRQSKKLERWMKQHFNRFRCAFSQTSKRNLITRQANKQAALNASAPSAGTMRLAKDITAYDLKGFGHWWDETAGPGPKLLKLIISLARGQSICPFTLANEKFGPPPIMSYWSFTTVHRELDLADVFVALTLEKRRPSLIVTASEKVPHLLVGKQFILPSDESTKLLLEDDQSGPADDIDLHKYARAVRKMKDEENYFKAKEIESNDGDSDSSEGKDGDEKEDDEQDDDEAEERIWNDLQEGGFVKICGTLHVVTYGRDRWAISINALEPGYYRYSPTLQPALLPLYVLIESLVQTAEEICGGEKAFATEERACSVKGMIEKEAVMIIKQLNDQRATSTRHIKAFNSLARRGYLASLTLSIGAPESAQRVAQVSALLKDDTFRLDNCDCPKGSEVWTTIMLQMKEGKPFMLTWLRSRISSEKVMNHLQKARLAIAIKSASQRAAHFPGWNAKKTLQEVVSIITDVQQVSMKRLNMRQTGMRIVECHKEGCEQPFGVETETKQAPNHWCKLGGPATLFRRYLGETVEDTPLLFPVDLFLHPAFQSRVEDLLPESDIQRIDREGSPAWINLNTGTPQHRQVFVDAQHSYCADAVARNAAGLVGDSEDIKDLAGAHWKVLCETL